MVEADREVRVGVCIMLAVSWPVTQGIKQSGRHELTSGKTVHQWRIAVLRLLCSHLCYQHLARLLRCSALAGVLNEWLIKRSPNVLEALAILVCQAYHVLLC